MVRRALLVVLAMACSGPPGGLPDAGPPPFEWRIDLGGLDDALLAVWTDGDEAIAVGGRSGRGLLLEWSGGATWRAPILPDDTAILWWAWAERGGDAIAVGERATVLRRAGGVWRPEPVEGLVHPDTTFYGVWGSSAEHVWVVGGSFSPGVPPIAILHFDGLVWSVEEVEALPQRLLFKVWGSGPDDVWAVGAEGQILRRDPTGWHPVESPTTQRLIAVSGRAAAEVFAVGGDAAGLVLRWDGAAWQSLGDAPEPLAGVWTAPGRPLFVGGNRGLLGRLVGDEWTWVRPVPDVDFHSLAGDPTGGRVLAVGADVLGGGADGWNGSLASHGGVTAGEIVSEPRPDAGPPDAAPPDASFPDGGRPGPGAMCELTDAGFPRCAAGLECWLLATSGVYLCTQPCQSAAECGGYGSGACCKRPGFQTLTTVCIPAVYAECTP